MTEMKSHASEGERLIIKRKGGGSIISHPPVFSPDAKVLYIVWGCSIRSYSTQTGEFLQEYEGTEHRCTGIQLIRDTEILATSSEVGEVIFWSRRSAVIQEKKVLSIEPHYKVTGFHFLGKDKDIFVILSSKADHYQNLVKFSYSGEYINKIEVKLNNSPRCIAFGGAKGSEYFGGIYRNKLHIMDLRTGRIIRHLVSSERQFVCVTAHESEEILATGDQSGCILIWRSFIDKKHPPKASYHWHTLPVSDIAFSQAGSSMYSGGGECVMVKWMLDFQDKKFLPRLGAPLHYLVVAPDNVLVAVSLEDNSIQLIDAHGKIKNVIQNFTWNTILSMALPGHRGIEKMRFDPRTKSLVLNGQPGHLQFLSLKSNSLLYNLDVVCQNYLTQERSTIIYNTEVTHVAFSCKGNWMATVEQRKDPDSSLESRIKFWKFNEKRQNFCMNTCIVQPHTGEVFSLEMRPGTEEFQDIMVVTSGSDQKFKIWSLIDCSSIYDKRDDQNSSQECWQCDGIGVYKGLPAGDIGFSSDGSILGAVFSHSLTLWDPASNELKSSLCHPEHQSSIRKIQFGNKDCSHLVVCVMPECLAVWNLLSLTMTWTVPIELNLLVADSLTNFMSAFTISGDLIVFKPSDPQPVLIKSNLSNDKILNAAFIPLVEPRPDLMNWQQKSQLYFMNEYQELLVLENPDDNFKEGARGGIQGDPEDGKFLALTPFGRMLVGVSQTSEVAPLSHSHFPTVGVPGENEIKEFLRIPPHTLPPLRTICHSFLTALIKKPGAKVDEEVTDVDIKEMDTEENDSDYGSDGVRDDPENDEQNPLSGSVLQDSDCNIYRPRIESTPELEKQLEKVLEESTKWVEKLF